MTATPNLDRIGRMIGDALRQAARELAAVYEQAAAEALRNAGTVAPAVTPPDTADDRHAGTAGRTTVGEPWTSRGRCGEHGRWECVSFDGPPPIACPHCTRRAEHPTPRARLEVRIGPTGDVRAVTFDGVALPHTIRRGVPGPGPVSPEGATLEAVEIRYLDTKHRIEAPGQQP
jgi:hypothetical protein